MLDKFENIKSGVFIKLLSKMTQQIQGEPIIGREDDQWILAIPKSFKKDFVDGYWITLEDGLEFDDEMVKVTILTLKEEEEGGESSPYLYKEYNIKLKKPMIEKEFKYFLNIDAIYEIDSVMNKRHNIDGGFFDVDNWKRGGMMWASDYEIFPIKIISNQRSILNWNEEPWGDLK